MFAVIAMVVFAAHPAIQIGVNRTKTTRDRRPASDMCDSFSAAMRVILRQS
jgi:hypothetical protein